MSLNREAEIEARTLTEQTLGVTENLPDAPLTVPAQNADDILEDELEASLGILNPQQMALLRSLQALFRSLRGPQDFLDAAGGFNRPPFPAVRSQFRPGVSREQQRRYR